MARKNGKTALIAALVLAHLVGPEQVINGEIYSAANDREQAGQVFKVCAQMIRLEPLLEKRLKIVDSMKRIVNYHNGTIYRAMSATSGTKHGLNPTFVIYDELAQAKNRELYDVLDTSMGARSEPLFVVISTQSNDPEHILSKLIDDGLSAKDPRICCHLYSVPEDFEDIHSHEAWALANPALGDFLNLADMEAESAKAQRNPAEEPRFRNLRLNQRVSTATSLISREAWMGCAGNAKIEEGEEIFLGLDLSSIIDLTGLVAVSAERKSRVMPFLFKPFGLLKEHSDRDFGAGNHRYVEWYENGHLLTSPGKSIQPEVIARKVGELSGKYKIIGLAYDRWRIEDLLREFDRIGLAAYKDGEEANGIRLVPWGQGFRDMAPAIDAVERAISEGDLIQPSNPVLTWNVANAIASTDPAGNRKLDKAKARFRIDGAVAMTMAMGLKARDRAVQVVDVASMIG